MDLQPSYGWLIAGALCLAIEAFGVPGIGFLFAGLAAILCGVFIHYDLIASGDLVAQFGCFFAVTAVLAALLWKKLKSWRLTGKSGAYQNMVGDVALVGKGGLRLGETGQVSWSGTTMMAEIAPSSTTAQFAEGTAVEIVDVKGNRLVVAARH